MVTNLDSDYVQVTHGRWKLGLKARLMAAGWFAAAACVPVFLTILVFGTALGGGAGSGFGFGWVIWFLWLFALIPVSAAMLLGFIFGGRIVDPIHRSTGRRAALWGTLVASCSYVLLSAAWAGSITLSSNPYRPASLSDAASSFLMLLFLGSILVGWLILGVGAVAGYLLYLASRDDPGRFVDAPGESVKTPNLWIAIAMLLFLANCAGLLLLSMPGQN